MSNASLNEQDKHVEHINAQEDDQSAKNEGSEPEDMEEGCDITHEKSRTTSSKH